MARLRLRTTSTTPLESSPAPVSHGDPGVTPLIASSPFLRDDTKKIPTSEPATEPDSPEPKALPVSGSYRHRRTGLTILSIVALGFWIYHANVTGSPSTSHATSALDKTAVTSTTLVKSPLAEINSILAQGAAYDAAHGSFTGFSPTLPSGALVGAAGPGMVVSLQSGPTCLYSGILPAGQRPVATDPTDQACTQALVSQAQATLQAEASAASSDATASMQAVAVQVEAALTTWSLSAGGTFSQVPSSINIANATLLSRSATTATVRVSVASSCEILTVQAVNPAAATQSKCS